MEPFRIITNFLNLVWHVFDLISYHRLFNIKFNVDEKPFSWFSAKQKAVVTLVAYIPVSQYFDQGIPAAPPDAERIKMRVKTKAIPENFIDRQPVVAIGERIKARGIEHAYDSELPACLKYRPPVLRRVMVGPDHKLLQLCILRIPDKYFLG
jgi:hypothetical protein